MNKSSYMGVMYEYDRNGYIIYFKDKYGNEQKIEFRAMFGNKVLNMDYVSAERVMKRKALYEIKKGNPFE